MEEIIEELLKSNLIKISESIDYEILRNIRAI